MDFTKFSTVSAFADKYEREGSGHLDLLILNSGIVRPKYIKTEDGWESACVTNTLIFIYFGYDLGLFILTSFLGCRQII